MRIIQVLSLLTIPLLFNAFGQESTPKAKVTSFAQTDMSQAAARFELYKKCDSIYGAEIRTRTGEFQKKMMNLMKIVRATEYKKKQSNAKLRKMGENFNQLRVKDSLAYLDTSANRMQRRKEVLAERLAAMKELGVEERRIRNDPEMIKIWRSIADLRKQIDDSVAVIVKNDTKCLSCYKAP
jgi:hypothetical protein